MYCVHCRRESGKGLIVWRNPCTQRAAQAAADMDRARPGQLLPSPPLVADDDRAPRNTIAQRRAKVREQARAKRDRVSQSVVAIRAAARVLELAPRTR